MNDFQKKLGIAALLIATTLVVFGRAVFFDFVNYDDGMYVYDNPPVMTGLTGAGLRYAFTTTDSGNFIPLTWISYEIDATISRLVSSASSVSQVSGDKLSDRLVNPVIFHATNLLFHVANVLLLFQILNRMTGSVGKSAVVALLFAIHPMHVESVVWIAERKDVLSTCLMLLAIWAYQSYLTCPSTKRYLTVLLLLCLGLAAKPMLVTLPALFLLMDVCVFNRMPQRGAIEVEGKLQFATFVRLCLEKLPLVFASLVCGYATIYAQSTTDAFRLSDRLPLSSRIGHAINSYGWYLTSTFWPVNRSPLYIHPVQQSATWNPYGVSTVATLSVLVAITSIVFWFKSPRKIVLFGWVWFLVTLLPVVGIIHVGNQAYADRYSYVPHIGLFIAVVWVAAACCSKLPAPFVWKSGLAGITSLALMILTWHQVSIWQDTGALWSQAVRVDPHNFIAHEGLALWFKYLEKYDLAAKHYLWMVELRPEESSDVPHEYLGWYFQKRSQWDSSEKHFRKAIEKSPQSSINWYKFGEMQAARGQHLEAIRCFEEADRWEPNNPEVHTYLGISLAMTKQTELAKSHFETAVQLKPNNPRYHLNLGSCLEELGDKHGASAEYQEVLRLDPRNREAPPRLRRLTNL